MKKGNIKINEILPENNEKSEEELNLDKDIMFLRADYKRREIRMQQIKSLLAQKEMDEETKNKMICQKLNIRRDEINKIQISYNINGTPVAIKNNIYTKNSPIYPRINSKIISQKSQSNPCTNRHAKRSKSTIEKRWEKVKIEDKLLKESAIQNSYENDYIEAKCAISPTFGVSFISNSENLENSFGPDFIENPSLGDKKYSMKEIYGNSCTNAKKSSNVFPNFNIKNRSQSNSEICSPIANQNNLQNYSNLEKNNDDSYFPLIINKNKANSEKSYEKFITEKFIMRDEGELLDSETNEKIIGISKKRDIAILPNKMGNLRYNRIQGILRGKKRSFSILKNIKLAPPPLGKSIGHGII